MDDQENEVSERIYHDELEKRITAAISRAIRKALLLHKQTGNPIYVRDDGQVKKIEAKDIKIDLDIDD